MASELRELRGVGPRLESALEQLGIHSVQDLLFHLPIRYQDRTRIVPIGSLRPGDQAVIQGEVELADIRYGRRRSLLVRLAARVLREELSAATAERAEP